MIDAVWLVPVFVIPGSGSLPFCCRLLLVFVDTVFMRLGALTVFLQFVGSVDCMAWPCFPRSWPFLFCHLALVGSRLFQSFAFLSYLVTCWGSPGDAQVVYCLLLLPLSLSVTFGCWVWVSFHPPPRLFLAPSRFDFATSLSVAAALCPVRSSCFHYYPWGLFLLWKHSCWNCSLRRSLTLRFSRELVSPKCPRSGYLASQFCLPLFLCTSSVCLYGYSFLWHVLGLV